MRTISGPHPPRFNIGRLAQRLDTVVPSGTRDIDVALQQLGIRQHRASGKLKAVEGIAALGVGRVEALEVDDIGGVVAHAVENAVVVTLGGEGVVAIATEQAIIAGPADELIVAAVTQQSVVAIRSSSRI